MSVYFATLAVRYLGTLAGLPADRLNRAENHSSWKVRSAAAEAIVSTNRRRAASLWLSELNSRYLDACRNAVRELSTLADPASQFDCREPADRDRAIRQFAVLAR
jgi:hypothetical protein